MDTTSITTKRPTAKQPRPTRRTDRLVCSSAFDSFDLSVIKGFRQTRRSVVHHEDRIENLLVYSDMPARRRRGLHGVENPRNTGSEAK